MRYIRLILMFTLKNIKIVYIFMIYTNNQLVNTKIKALTIQDYTLICNFIDLNIKL